MSKYVPIVGRLGTGEIAAPCRLTGSTIKTFVNGLERPVAFLMDAYGGTIAAVGDAARRCDAIMATRMAILEFPDGTATVGYAVPAGRGMFDVGRAVGAPVMRRVRILSAIPLAKIVVMALAVAAI